MKIVTFASAKGGVGKSTLAIGLGVAAQQDGEQVYIVDCDPQASVVSWGERREADTPGVDSSTPGELAEALAALRRAKYTLVLIDTQGSDAGGASEAMRLSHFVCVPVRPFMLDVLGVRPTRDSIARLGKPYCLILNAVQPRVSARVADAGEALGGRLAPSIVNRFIHADAVAAGQGPTEFEPQGAAAAEIRELWAFIKGKMQ